MYPIRRGPQCFEQSSRWHFQKSPEITGHLQQKSSRRVDRNELHCCYSSADVVYHNTQLRNMLQHFPAECLRPDSRNRESQISLVGRMGQWPGTCASECDRNCRVADLRFPQCFQAELRNTPNLKSAAFGASIRHHCGTVTSCSILWTLQSIRKPPVFSKLPDQRPRVRSHSAPVA